MRFDDRTQDTTTTTGTGNLTLSGTPPTGRVAFGTAFAVGDRFAYLVESESGADWEVGEGYLSAATTLVRETVKRSSNSDLAVNFDSGTKRVMCVWPAWVAQPIVDGGVAYHVGRGSFFP